METHPDSKNTRPLFFNLNTAGLLRFVCFVALGVSLMLNSKTFSAAKKENKHREELKIQAPSPVAAPHFSLLPTAGGLIFCSGMLAIDPKTGEREHGTVTTETRRIFENLKLLLEPAGSSLERRVQVHAMIYDRIDYDVLNRAERRFVPNAPPARPGRPRRSSGCSSRRTVGSSPSTAMPTSSAAWRLSPRATRAGSAASSATWRWARRPTPTPAPPSSRSGGST